MSLRSCVAARDRDITSTSPLDRLLVKIFTLKRLRDEKERFSFLTPPLVSRSFDRHRRVQGNSGNLWEWSVHQHDRQLQVRVPHWLHLQRQAADLWRWRLQSAVESLCFTLVFLYLCLLYKHLCPSCCQILMSVRMDRCASKMQTVWTCQEATDASVKLGTASLPLGSVLVRMRWLLAKNVWGISSTRITLQLCNQPPV